MIIKQLRELINPLIKNYFKYKLLTTKLQKIIFTTKILSLTNKIQLHSVYMLMYIHINTYTHSYIFHTHTLINKKI